MWRLALAGRAITVRGAVNRRFPALRGASRRR